MKISTSYKSILNLSLPIMIGSAAQNVIALTDSIFLYHYRELEFATIGIVSVFYLIIAAIGFGFSRGGQILIARAYGENEPSKVGKIFRAILTFEVALAIGIILFIWYGSEFTLSFFIDDPEIASKSVEYLKNRSYGVFFSYVGVGMVAFYSGIGRTWFITIDTFVLLFSNIILNYSLIFGKFGLPEMGIAGAGLASSISEALAFVCFVAFMFYDKPIRKFNLLKFVSTDWALVRKIYKVSSSMIVLSSLSLGSWFLFFSMIENMGTRPLAISNVARIMYLILTVPTWGFSSGINTLISQLVGNRKRHGVLPLVRKTTYLTLFTALLITLPVLIFPKLFLIPLLGTGDMQMIEDSVPLMRLLFFIIMMFGLGAIYFNGLIGTGSVWLAIRIQVVVTLIYLIYAYLVINVWKLGLIWAWSAEILYWLLLFIAAGLILRKKGWYVN